MNLKGKKGLVMGVANSRSIAWGIAKMLSDYGASIIFSYHHEIFRKKVEQLASEVNSAGIYECDVSKEGDIEKLFAQINEPIDFIVHTPAFADKNELKGEYLQTTRKNFLNCMNISCYSLTEVCRCAFPLLNKGASIITLTYLGAQRVIPNYNVMGLAKAALEASVRYLANDLGKRDIRVNAVSAGAIKTLAASGISDFSKFLEIGEKASPLKRNVTQEEIAGLAVFLMSDLASGITGGTHYVDAGYNIMGMSEDVGETA